MTNYYPGNIIGFIVLLVAVMGLAIYISVKSTTFKNC